MPQVSFPSLTSMDDIQIPNNEMGTGESNLNDENLLNGSLEVLNRDPLETEERPESAEHIGIMDEDNIVFNAEEQKRE